jgi:tetratricopeptide (TPR) repeat protein
MLTTKNECEDGKRVRIHFHLCFLVFLAFAVALAGCGPPGTRALLKGKKLLDQGDYAGAADELKAATEVMTTNAEAWNYLGVAEQHSGQLEEAASAYQRALELDRDLMEAHYNLGCLRLEENKPDDAINEFTAYTLRRANAPEGWLKLGVAQLHAKEIAQAEKSFSTVQSLSPNNAEALNGLGLARMYRGRPEDAEKFFQAAVQYHPDYGPAILNLATVEHEYLHNDRLALENYHVYLALNPRPADWDGVNTIVSGMEQSQVAVASPPKNQQSPPSWQSQATTQPTQPREQQTRPQTQRTTSPKSQNARPYPGTPREHAETTEAQPETPVVSTPNPTPRTETQTDMFAPSQANQQTSKPSGGSNLNPLNWFRSAPSQEEVKVTPLPAENTETEAPKPVRNAQPAMPSFIRYSYLHPGRPASGDRHAASLAFGQARENEREGKWTDALDSYRKATQLDPSWFEAQYNCGVMAYRLRDWDFSLSSYEIALAIQPDSADARYNFALALKAAGYVPDAVNELKRILESNPDDVRAHLELGNLYAQQLRDVPRARAEYTKVIQLDPGNPQASNIQFWLIANPQ